MTVRSDFNIVVNENTFHLQLGMRLTERELVAALRWHGHKLTPQRRVVVEVITYNQDHFTPADIYSKVHREHPNIGLITIYRTLEMLTELGLICGLHAGGTCRSYTTGAIGHHHHLICSNCGTVIDFTSHNLGELEQNLSEESGFRIDGYLLEFVGLCQTCQKAT
ncbi:Fur family transcriptional regulator [Chloroflexota bacterium]